MSTQPEKHLTPKLHSHVNLLLCNPTDGFVRSKPLLLVNSRCHREHGFRRECPMMLIQR